MDRNRYSPPDAAVVPVSHERLSEWRRVKWIAIAVYFFMAAIAAVVFPILAPHFTLKDAVLGGALCLLFLYHPVRGILLLRESVSPRWWDCLYLVSIGISLLGLQLDSADMMIVAGLPVFVTNAIIPVVIWRVERRSSVRIYLKGRGYAYVHR